MTPEPPAPLRVGTRGSELALWQARRVKRLIEERLHRDVELRIIETTGDRDQLSPLESIGTVGAFTKEIERALLAGEIDVAVHSLKDLPTKLPEGLALAAVPERAAVNDVLIARVPLKDLPAGARVGSSSRRRRLQLPASLRVEEIRGNVPTRIEKCRRGDYDAIVLAAAGLDRLALQMPEGLRRFDLPADEFIPAPAQGALGIETRTADVALISALDDPAISGVVAAERELLRLVEGGCSVPLGAHARRLDDGRIELRAILGYGDRGEEGAFARHALVRAENAEAAARLALRILRPDGALDGEGDARRLDGKRVVLTRDDAELRLHIRRAGGQARVIEAIHFPGALDLPQMPGQPVRWFLFSSGRAMKLAQKYCDGAKRVGAVGPQTAENLSAAGIPVDLLPEQPDALGLADAFLALGEPKDCGVLLPGAAEPRPELRERLEQAGYRVHALPLYRTEPTDAKIPEDADVVVFASPSAVRKVPPRAKVVAIGRSTAAAVRREIGVDPAVAPRPTALGLLEAIHEAMGTK